MTAVVDGGRRTPGGAMFGDAKPRTSTRAMGLLLVITLLAWSPTAMPEPAAADDPVGSVEESTPPLPSDEVPPPEEPPPPPPPPPPFRPQPGPVFNNPAGTSAERLAINDHLLAAINHAPRGATMRIALYSGSIPSFKDAVIAAYRRGVNVRLIMDGHASGFEWWKAMVRVLGTNRSRPSFATVCQYSCFDTRITTLQHSKLYLFSRTGAATRVAMLGSGNPTFAQANKGWNDLFTFVEDKVMYDAFVAYFDAMVRSASKSDNVNYYRTVSSGKYRAVFSPAQHARDADYYGRVLNKIHCTAAPGYGENKRTKVIVVMGLWSRSRVNNAERLWRLDEAGCDVEAIVASHDLDYKVRAWLRKPGRNGGITFHAASRDFDGNGTIDRYLHEKVVMVNGGYGTQSNAVLTFMGTHNFTYNAFRGNNDVILRIADRAIHARWEEQVALLRQHSALVPRSNVARAARIPPTVDLTQDRANLDSPKAYAD